MTVAFPTIPTAAATRIISALQSDTTATRTFPSLTGLTKNSGDLLIAIVFAYQTNATADQAFSGWTGGFTEFGDRSSSTTTAIGMAYKWSTGSETGTFAVTQAATITGNAVMIVMAIPGAHASTPPEAGTKTDGTTAAADIAAFNPTGWDVEDTLWIAVGGCGETGTGGSFFGMSATTRHTAPWAANVPTNYGDGYGTGCTTDAIGGIEGAVGFRQLAAASDDPAAFAPDLSNARNSALLIAVRPAADPVDHL